MAGETDGVVGMGEEQPMDLSRPAKKSTRIMPPLIPINLLPPRRFNKRGAEPASREEPQEDWRSEKRSRLDEEDCWEGPARLDRARSVPQLTPLNSLQRYKSLSESRIPVAAAEAATTSDELVDSSWIYIGYYSQLLHRFQAQELLRQLSLKNQPGQVNGNAESTVNTNTSSSEDSFDLKRRQTRPLTGKHVRPGTGASPATLLTLRRKIQARQQQPPN